jgi:signal transduction histidine kinase
MFMPSPEINAHLPEISGGSDLAVSLHFALFPTVQLARADNLFLHQRASMVTMSYQIEDQLLQARQPGVIFSGFQHLSRFIPQAGRYQQIAARGHQVYVFGIADQKPESFPGIHFVELTERHALAREWFVIANAPEYFSALVAEELTELSPTKPSNRLHSPTFQGIWSFDEGLVSDLTRLTRESLGLQPASLPVITTRDYEKQLSAIAVLANRLVSRLEQRNQDLINQQQNYEDLVNMLVHDLRGSLTSVIGSLELIASHRYEDHQELHELVNNSLVNSQRLAQMISDVLDVSKMEAGYLNLNRQMLDTGSLLRSVYDRWFVAAQWENKELSLEMAQVLPMIIADAEKIERVLDNLVSNALKYGEKIKISANFQGNQVVIQISDNGPGIPPEQSDQIFNKFTAAHGQGIQRKGTGLGLTFCKMAVEAHGGQIRVSSLPGGAVFSIQLPLVPPITTDTNTTQK